LLKLGSSNFFEIAMDLDPVWGKGGKLKKEMGRGKKGKKCKQKTIEKITYT
jgi:hypothetical protein